MATTKSKEGSLKKRIGRERKMAKSTITSFALIFSSLLIMVLIAESGSTPTGKSSIYFECYSGLMIIFSIMFSFPILGHT